MFTDKPEKPFHPLKFLRNSTGGKPRTTINKNEKPHENKKITPALFGLQT